MSQEIEKAYDPLVQHLRDALDGVQTHGAALKIKQNDAASIQLVLDALVGQPAGPNNNPPAVPGAKQIWDEAQATKSDKTGLYRLACSNGRALAAIAIGILKPRLGNRYNAAWKAAGFTNNSLAVPTDPGAMLKELGDYFTTHPDHAAPTLTPLAVSAVTCHAASAAILAAAEASKESNVAAGQAQAAFEAAKQAARDRLSALREELSHLIADDSPLWYAFGFDRPVDTDGPSVVMHLVVVPGVASSRSLFPHWDDSRRADAGYRVAVANFSDGAKITELLVEGTVASLTDLPANTKVNVTVTARGNNGKESAPCEPFTIVVP